MYEEANLNDDRVEEGCMIHGFRSLKFFSICSHAIQPLLSLTVSIVGKYIHHGSLHLRRTFALVIDLGEQINTTFGGSCVLVARVTSFILFAASPKSVVLRISISATPVLFKGGLTEASTTPASRGVFGVFGVSRVAPVPGKTDAALVNTFLLDVCPRVGRGFGVGET